MARDKICAKKRKTEKEKEEDLAVSSAHVAKNEHRMSGINGPSYGCVLRGSIIVRKI